MSLCLADRGGMLSVSVTWFLVNGGVFWAFWLLLGALVHMEEGVLAWLVYPFRVHRAWVPLMCLPIGRRSVGALSS